MSDMINGLPKYAAINIVDKETDGDVDGREQVTFPSEFPAGEIQDETNTGPEFDQYKRPRQAELGQELTQLTTEREHGKPKQNLTEPARWNESYTDENRFEDADGKLGESDEDHGTLSKSVYPPYTDGIGQPNPRYEDPDKGRFNITLHASEKEEIDPNKGPDYIWIAVDLDGTILEPPPDNQYASETGEHVFGQPIEGAKEALQEMIDNGAVVSIYTARQYFADGEDKENELIEAVSKVLGDNKIPFTDVYVGKKPPAHHFIDDKGISFNGDWNVVLDAIRDQLQKTAHIKRAQYSDYAYKIYQQSLTNDELRNTLYNYLGQYGVEDKVLESERTIIDSISQMMIAEPEFAVKLFDMAGLESSGVVPSQFPPEDEIDLQLQEYREKILTQNLPENLKEQVLTSPEYEDYPETTEQQTPSIEQKKTKETVQKEYKRPIEEGQEYYRRTTPPGGILTERPTEDLGPKLSNDPTKAVKDYHGIKMDVEWPKGSIRSYKGSDTYATHMKCDYGYAAGVEGSDGEELDIYLGPDDTDTAFIIEQMKEDGSYDEDKVMLGFASEEDAIEMYLQHMPSYMLGEIRAVPIETLHNALYGEPEDRRGKDDLVPNEEKTAEDKAKKHKKKKTVKTKSDYVGPQSSQSGGIGGVGGPAADIEADKEAGNLEFAEFAIATAHQNPDMQELRSLLGDRVKLIKEQIKQEEKEEESPVSRKLTNPDGTQVELPPPNVYSEQIKDILKGLKEKYDPKNSDRDIIARSIIIDPEFKQKIEKALGFTVEDFEAGLSFHESIPYRNKMYWYSKNPEKQLEVAEEERNKRLRELREQEQQLPNILINKDDEDDEDIEVIASKKWYFKATQTWPEDDPMENEYTDGTEDRENRDIPRPPNTEKMKYRNS